MGNGRRRIGLIVLAFIMLLSLISSFYKAYQGMFFYLVMAYFLIFSMFLRPQPKAPQKNNDKTSSWSAFESKERTSHADTEGEDEYEFFDDDQSLNVENDLSRMFKEFGLDEAFPEEAPISNRKSDTYGKGWSSESLEDDLKAGPKMKDWGTILYEKINSSAKRGTHTASTPSEEEDESRYASDSRDKGGKTEMGIMKALRAPIKKGERTLKEYELSR